MKKSADSPEGVQDPFAPRKKADECESSADVHVFGKGHICRTEGRGFATPNNRSPLEIVVDASDGFIPLWEQNLTLRWKFDETSMAYFASPKLAKKAIRKMLAEALLLWGDARPIRFSESKTNWDFQITMQSADDCEGGGCVLASAFFPDQGRHHLRIYPQMFGQTREEQVETLIHELGHVFGLRHFFAQVRESSFPSEVFGEHEPFSIMNYGANSELTDQDRADLKSLYEMAWNGTLTNINGTNIRFVRPFHYLGTG